MLVACQVEEVRGSDDTSRWTGSRGGVRETSPGRLLTRGLDQQWISAERAERMRCRGN